nr:hypothetical protein [Tanacetum cinerariifolium]
SHHVTLSSLSLSCHRPTTPVTTRTTTTKLRLLEDYFSDKWDTFINMDKSRKGTNRTNKSYVDEVAATRHEEKDEPSISAPKHVNATTVFVDDTDFALDIPTDSPTTIELVNTTKDNFDEDDLVKFQEQLLDAEKPLYEGCSDFTKLSTIVKLLNLKGKYRASDKFFTELLGLIKKMLPAVGILCGCPYSGFKGCVVCGKDTNCVRLSASSKQSYVGHRRYLPYNHPFRKQKKAFNGQQEFLSALILITREQLYNENKNTTEEEDSSSQVNGQNEKNVAESLVETLLHVLGKTKDEVNAQLDLAELGVKLKLFAMKEEDKTTLPPEGYT